VERRLGAFVAVALHPQRTPKTHVCAHITRRKLDRPAEEGLCLCECAAVLQQQLSKSAV
jgi:hypothetical protein